MYFCSFLTFVDYLSYPAKSLKNIKETFVLSSFHCSSSRWNQEGKKFSSWETRDGKTRTFSADDFRRFSSPPL